MKFLHVADLHLGRQLGDFDLFDDQKHILDRLVEIAVADGAEAVLVAGDVYDKSVPSEAAAALFDGFLNALAEKKISAYIISGNHDSDGRLGFGSGLFRSNGIYISTGFGGKIDRYTVEDRHGKLNIWLLPFVKASQVRRFYPDAEITDYNSAVKTAVENSGVDFSERNILVAHQFVVGNGVDPELGGSESASVQSVGTVEKISSSCFDGFDYVALGHIHSAQQVGRETVRYAGSPLKYSLSEAGGRKYATLVDVGEKGNVSVKLEPLTPLRDLRHLKGRLSQLLDGSSITSPEDFIYVTLTDEEIIDNAIGIFCQYYPNTVRIAYENSHTLGTDGGEIFNMGSNKTFSELISEFYSQIYGCEISEAELKMMKEAAKEAGISDETD